MRLDFQTLQRCMFIEQTAECCIVAGEYISSSCCRSTYNSHTPRPLATFITYPSHQVHRPTSFVTYNVTYPYYRHRLLLSTADPACHTKLRQRQGLPWVAFLFFCEDSYSQQAQTPPHKTVQCFKQVTVSIINIKHIISLKNAYSLVIIYRSLTKKCQFSTHNTIQILVQLKGLKARHYSKFYENVINHV